MLFNSFHFLVFFAVVTLAFFTLPHRYRWFLLLASSCYFYMAFVPIYVLILAFTIVIDYFAGIWLERTHGKKRRLLLVASLVSNVGVLAFFKYYNFLNDNLTALLYGAGFTNPIPYLSILLPIGLSFHTFQAMSYTIEVYREKQKAEHNFGIYALYVMFYPQLVAGPIERPQNLLHQFYEEHFFDYVRVTDGLKLMAWGLFKKMVIADRLAIVSDAVYNNPHAYSGPGFLVATLAFSFQIYCDFSGYSDMAIGAARVMGFKLMKNFDRPYSAKSISEFWKRWHISLSSWFRDYLYLSLGGNRVSLSRWYFNLFFVFLVSGLWHGANWTYVIWGALHGAYLIGAILLERPRKKVEHLIGLDRRDALNNTVQCALTCLLAGFAWIFFRANSVDDAFYIVGHLFSGFSEGLTSVAPLLEKSDWIVAGISVLVMEGVQYLHAKGRLHGFLVTRPLLVRWGLYYGLIAVILLFGQFENRQFIYFQF